MNSEQRALNKSSEKEPEKTS